MISLCRIQVRAPSVSLPPWLSDAMPSQLERLSSILFAMRSSPSTDMAIATVVSRKPAPPLSTKSNSGCATSTNPLNGLAGTGKTTIAQTIAERLFADGRLGAPFFCSREFEDRSDLKFIFPTLAVQLARNYATFRSALIPLVQSDPDIIHESLYSQMKKLIVGPLTESKLSTVIVIDALDECKDDEPASAILSVLGQLVAEIPETKFFVIG